MGELIQVETAWDIYIEMTCFKDTQTFEYLQYILIIIWMELLTFARWNHR
jgi:hypothetical protein